MNQAVSSTSEKGSEEPSADLYIPSTSVEVSMHTRKIEPGQNGDELEIEERINSAFDEVDYSKVSIVWVPIEDGNERYSEGRTPNRLTIDLAIGEIVPESVSITIYLMPDTEISLER